MRVNKKTRLILDDFKQEIIIELKRQFDNKIRLQCEELVHALFSDKNDEEFIRLFFDYQKIRTLGGEIKQHVVKAALKEFDEQYKTNIKEVVEGEEFIDLIIGRINKKQLK